MSHNQLEKLIMKTTSYCRTVTSLGQTLLSQQPPVRDLQKYVVQAILYLPKMWCETKKKMMGEFLCCLVFTAWEICGCYCCLMHNWVPIFIFSRKLISLSKCSYGMWKHFCVYILILIKWRKALLSNLLEYKLLLRHFVFSQNNLVIFSVTQLSSQPYMNFLLFLHSTHKMNSSYTATAEPHSL